MVFRGNEIANALGQDGTIVALLRLIAGLSTEAVMFFFLISGFCICLSLGKISSDAGIPNWRLYAWHRARRILPVFWLALIVAFLLVRPDGPADPRFSTKTLLGNLAMLQLTENARGSWVVPFARNEPLWSLSHEAFYYLSMPLLFALFFAKRRVIDVHSGTLLILFVVLALLAIAVNQIFPNPFSHFVSLWPVWIVGFVIANAIEKQAPFYDAFFVTLVSAIVLAILAGAIHSDTVGQLSRGLFVSVVAIAMLIASKFPTVGSVLQSHWTRQAIGIFATVGGGSYAIYAWHYPLILAFSRVGGGVGLAAALVALASLVIVAPIVEKQLQAVTKRLTGPASAPRHSRG